MDLKVQKTEVDLNVDTYNKDAQHTAPELSDAIPEDLLFALTSINDEISPATEPLKPIKRFKTPKELRNIIKKGPPDNLWHHKGRRIQFKHLTEFPRGDGKAFGTRDVSFLYDVAAEDKPKQSKISVFDKSASRFEELNKTSSMGSSLAIPDTIIPDEYHMVKSNAVLGLEHIDEDLATHLVDKSKTLRVFPSLKPSKRFEVLQLAKTLDIMLEKVGLNDLESEIKGPTQIHNLLELIKKEQQIYDTVFHEVIRQTTIECSERGQLLSKLRQRYADLIARIPQQIQSLHAEVMAQRSLDRRLTEELLRFKTSIGTLTSELSTVKEHDKAITKQAEEAQLDLAEALKESHANSCLVNEYHELYELQRHRLEQQIINLTEERELWSNAAYSLCLKVMQNNSLITAKRLHVTKKAWARLASHLTVLLSDKDTESFVQLQQHVDKWREGIFHLHQVLESEDKQLHTVLDKLEGQIKTMLEFFTDVFLTINPINEVRSMKIPRQEDIENTLNTLKQWEETVVTTCDRFGGDNLLLNQERIIALEKELEAWTDVALAVYGRHRSFEGERYAQQEEMVKNNMLVTQLYRQIGVRVVGENGVAKGLSLLQATIENWINKIVLSLKGASVLGESDWMKYYDDFTEILSHIKDVKSIIGTQQLYEDRQNNLPFTHIHIQDTIKIIQAWMKNTVNGVDGEDGKLSAQVSKVHSDMTHWVVLVLLHLAPDIDAQSNQESSIGVTCTLEELTSRCKDLAENVSMLTSYLSQCVSSVVEKSLQEKREFGEADADHEYRDFLRFKVECKEWIHTCELLINSLQSEPIKIISDNIMDRVKLSTTVVEVKSEADEETKSDSTVPTVPVPPSTPKPQTRKQSADIEKGVHTKEAAIKSMEAEPAKQQEQQQEVKDEVKEINPEPTQDNVVSSEPEVAVVAETSAKSATKMIENMAVIGNDENVTSANILDNTMPADGSLTQPSSALTQSAYDAIAKMDQLQTQLLETEERAQKAESQSIELQHSLNDASEKIRMLEKKIAELRNEPPPEPKENKTPPASATLSTSTEEKTKPPSPSETTRKTPTRRASPSAKKQRGKKK